MLPQSRRSRAQVLELLLGPNGDTAFRSEQHKADVWEQVQREITEGFAEQWHVAQVERKDFAAIAESYARDVLTERIPSCEWVRLACDRHLLDLARDVDGTWEYRFDR